MQRINISLDVSDEVAKALPARVAQVQEEDTRVIDGITYRGLRPKYAGENAVQDCLADQLQRFVQQLMPDIFLPQDQAESVSRDYQAAMDAMRAARTAQMVSVTASIERDPETPPYRKPIVISPIETPAPEPKEEI